MISGQFKHPQVHVGDGVEGPAAQKNHFGCIVILHASFWGEVSTTAAHMERKAKTEVSCCG